MSKKVKILGIVFGLIVILIVGLVSFYYSSAGKEFLLSYIEKRLPFVKNMQIKSFNYEFNAFSINLQKGLNNLYIYGDFFPFEGIYEGDFKKLEDLTTELRGEFKSKGDFRYSNQLYITGNALFANGYGDFSLNCSDNCKGYLKGVDFNTSKFLYMIKLNIPGIKFNGKNTLNVSFKSSDINSNAKFKGNIDFYGSMLKNIYINLRAKIQNRDEYNAKLIFKNSKINGWFKLTSQNFISLFGKLKADLETFRKFTLYPFKGTEEFKVQYNSKDVLKFSSQYINGVVYPNGVISLNISQMPSKLFFKRLGFEELIKGKVNGSINIDINHKGMFNIIITPVKVQNNYVINKILKITGIKTKEFETFLMKGYFDTKKAVINMIAKNSKKNILISLQEGIYYYNNRKKYKFPVEVMVGENKYIFIIENNKVKTLKILKVDVSKQEILVY